MSPHTNIFQNWGRNYDFLRLQKLLFKYFRAPPGTDFLKSRLIIDEKRNRLNQTK